jgi:hypothetical protein
MQQGFGIILLADEVMRERRAAEMADARRAREAREARESRRVTGRTSAPGRPRRLAIRVSWFVIELTFVPTRRRAPAGWVDAGGWASTGTTHGHKKEVVR